MIQPAPALRPRLAGRPRAAADLGRFPALCALSLALPFGAGWAIGGTWHTALAALLWAELARVALLQHVTWSVNSLCHMFGSRRFTTRLHDRATNLWPLCPAVRSARSSAQHAPLRPLLRRTA